MCSCRMESSSKQGTKNVNNYSDYKGSYYCNNSCHLAFMHMTLKGLNDIQHRLIGDF